MTPSHNGADSALPADLAGLERQLAERSRGTTPVGFRQRVLAAMRRESGALDHSNRRRLRWQWLAASAAAVLVAINFSTSVVNNMDWRLAGGIERAEVAAAVRHIQVLGPELSPEEVRRQALLLRAGARVTPAPYGSSSLVRLLQQRHGHTSWVADN